MSQRESFSILDDDWALIEFLPSSNAAWARTTFRRMREHHEAPAQQNPVTIQAPFVVPEPPYPITGLTIERSELTGLLTQEGFREIQLLCSESVTSQPAPFTGGFAHAGTGPGTGTNTGGAIVYGRCSGDLVEVFALAHQLDRARSGPHLRRVLRRLGSRFNLLLADYPRQLAVDLTHQAAIDAYLASDD